MVEYWNYAYHSDHECLVQILCLLLGKRLLLDRVETLERSTTQVVFEMNFKSECQMSPKMEITVHKPRKLEWQIISRIQGGTPRDVIRIINELAELRSGNNDRKEGHFRSRYKRCALRVTL
jgi:hypothetical protein